MATNYPFNNTFLTQLMTINIRSREFPNDLTKMLASQENVNTALSLQGEDALTLIDILDQASEAPNVPLNVQRRSVRILQRVCGSRAILPRSCILSENILKVGDIAFASGGFSDVWKGRHDGNLVCVKAFRTYTAEKLLKIKQRLFQEIVVWRRLSHPNVLPVLGVSPKLFPLCIVSEWMINGNIVDFTSRHSEVNRLRLLAKATSGLQYLHSMDIIHGDLNPTTIVIDSNFHPRLTDYGIMAIISDPNTVDPSGTTSPSVGTVRYMAPELQDPTGFDQMNSNPTKKSDIYAFGMVTYQVVTGERPFSRVGDDRVADRVAEGERPNRPPDHNEWVSDEVWDLISSCWSSSWDDRPGVESTMGALNRAADVVGARRRKVTAPNGQGKRTPRIGSASGVLSKRRVDGSPIQEVLQPSPPSPLPPQIPATPSPFITKTPANSKAKQRERKKQRQRVFRTWYDSSGLHWRHAALVHYKAGIVHLSSSDGTLLEIPEDKLAPDDLDYLHAQEMYTKAQRKNSPLFGRWFTRLKRWVGVRKAMKHPHPPPESQMNVQDVTPQFTPTGSVTQIEPCETEIIAFLRECQAGTENDLVQQKAQDLADRLDTALVCGDLCQRKRRHYLRHLRKLCGGFGILPSSLLVTRISIEPGSTPVAFGGSSDVYKATFERRSVAVKTLRPTNGGKLDRVHRLLVQEVVGWKTLQHPNVVPFIGVVLAPPLVSIVSEWMDNGDIMYFTRNHPEHNRLGLLIDTVTGLEYLHSQGIVHGDLKGANVLVDSHRRARLVDFGLAVIVDESAAGSAIETSGIRGTIRWMAPELMSSKMFGFTEESKIRLPSRGTDVYALGMTILEVITGCHPFNDIIIDPAVIARVIGGGRPDRPSSGFTDELWELLKATWLVEYGSQPPKRPTTAVVLDLLNKEVDNWGKTIFPPRVVGKDDDDSNQTITPIYPIFPPSRPPGTDPGSRPNSPGIAGDIREFFKLATS